MAMQMNQQSYMDGQKMMHGQTAGGETGLMNANNFGQPAGNKGY